jgi:hypothetical protein
MRSLAERSAGATSDGNFRTRVWLRWAKAPSTAWTRGLASSAAAIIELARDPRYYEGAPALCSNLIDMIR